MNDVIFHSLYNNCDMTSLKHSLLYFDKVTVPSNSYPLNLGEKVKHICFLQLIPDDIYEQIEYLRKNNFIEVKEFKGNDKGNPAYYWNYIVDEINRMDSDRFFPQSEILDICRFINLNPKHQEVSRIANQAAIFIAAVCLMEFSAFEQICCVDNPIIYDTLNLGIKAIINSLDERERSKIRYKKLKSNLLASKLIAVNLPSFEFSSFDDIFELKNRFKNSLQALHYYLFDLTDKIESLPYEETFDREVDEFIANKIQPEINSFRDEIKQSASKLAKTAYLPLKNTALTVMLSTAYPELTQQILFGGLSYTLIETLFRNYYLSRKKIKESPFSIFINTRYIT